MSLPFSKGSKGLKGLKADENWVSASCMGVRHTDTAAGVRRTAEAEGVDVGLDLLEVDAVLLRASRQQLGVVDSLRATHDLLAAHEHVVRVRITLHRHRQGIHYRIFTRNTALRTYAHQSMEP